MIQNPNFLILDEPTNDLDIVTLNVLEDFLLDFPGCLLVVSHDRYFMDKIVDHLFVFRGEGEVEDFPGNYSDYRDYELSAPPVEIQKSEASDAVGQKKNEVNKLSYNEKKELKSVESKVRSLELDKKALEAKFHDSSLNKEQINKLSAELQTIIDKMEKNEARWFELSEKLEN